MTLVQKCLWLAVVAIVLTPVPCSAQDKAKTEDLKEMPGELKSLVQRTTTGPPMLAAVFFFEPGTNINAQSVTAGKRFDIVVFLSNTATADVQVTVTAFRLDASGVGSGTVKVLPIVVGTGADEKYWAVAPPSPVTIKSGFLGVRIHGVQVLQNAKQPPDGDATKPFVPVVFPDHVIMFVKQGDVVLAPTLRVAKP
jgi:hypothetical protein